MNFCETNSDDTYRWENVILRDQFIDAIPQMLQDIQHAPPETKQIFNDCLYKIFDSVSVRDKNYFEIRHKIVHALSKKSDIFLSMYEHIHNKEEFLEVVNWLDLSFPKKSYAFTLFDANRALFLRGVAENGEKHSTIFGRMMLHYGEKIAYELVKIIKESPQVKEIDLRTIAENASYFEYEAVGIIGSAIFRKMGLPSEYVTIWKKSLRDNLLYEDIEVAYQLYKMNSLLPIRLYQMAGIVHFSILMSDEMLANFNEFTEAKKREIMIIHASSVSLGEFSVLGSNLVSSILSKRKQQRRNIGFRHIQYSNFKDLIDRIQSILPLIDKQLILILEDHGTPNTCGMLDVNHINTLIDTMVDNPSVTLVFNSCSTGVEGGLAQQVSDKNILCIGPDNDTSLKNLSIKQSSNNVHIVIRYVDANAKYYKAGVLIKSLKPHL